MSMTVDGVIRVFSISRRYMVAQYKVDETLRAAGTKMDQGSMITWFSAQGGTMAVSPSLSHS